MESKFIFFDAKRNFIINFFVICQMALWIFFMSSLISLIYFNNSYKKHCESSFPIDKSASIELNDFILDTETGKPLYNTITKVTSALESHGYTCGFRSSSLNYYENTSIPLNVVHATKNDIKSNFSTQEGYFNTLTPYYMDKYTIDSYKKNITGTIDIDSWDLNGDIPVVLGSNYSSKNNIGDKFSVKGKSYKIVGFFNKDTLTTEESDITNGTYSLNGCFVIPMDKKLFLESYQCQPVFIYSKHNINVADINKIIAPISKKIIVHSVKVDIENFLVQQNNDANYKIIRLGIISLLIICSLILTLSYEILINKKRIGILFSFGITKNKIFLILSYEFMIITLLGMIFGSVLYFLLYKQISFIYLNETLASSIYISIAVLILILFIILRFSFNLVNKLTPKEMIGGFIE